jgi:hypothetical protein
MAALHDMVNPIETAVMPVTIELEGVDRQKSDDTGKLGATLLRRGLYFCRPRLKGCDTVVPV